VYFGTQVPIQPKYKRHISGDSNLGLLLILLYLSWARATQRSVGPHISTSKLVQEMEQKITWCEKWYLLRDYFRINSFVRAMNIQSRKRRHTTTQRLKQTLNHTIRKKKPTLPKGRLDIFPRKPAKLNSLSHRHQTTIKITKRVEIVGFYSSQSISALESSVRHSKRTTFPKQQVGPACDALKIWAGT
jgi:hypothetical protein